jgi:hypothetical protein
MSLVKKCKASIWCAPIMFCYCSVPLTWSEEPMWEVMYAWVIIHNMIIETEYGDLVARDDHFV